MHNVLQCLDWTRNSMTLHQIIFQGAAKMKTIDGIRKLHFDVCGADKNLQAQ